MEKDTLKPDHPQGDFRVLRGGGWYDGPRRARVADRYGGGPGHRGGGLGFRIVFDSVEEPCKKTD
jgi:formylglycine-generating enzyme required for sulfatase activity